MTAELVFLLDTVGKWAGYILLFRAAFLGLQLFWKPAGINLDRAKKGATVASLVGALLVLITFFLPSTTGREIPAGWTIPIVWVYMTFPGWLAVVALFMVGARGVQAITALNSKDAVAKWKSTGVWLLIFIGGLLWFRTWEGARVDIIRGLIPVQPMVIILFAVLLLATMAAMVYAARFTHGRGLSKNLVTTAALLTGCVLFGIPFLWLVLTSFKEERDMAAKEGIVWVPQVQLTHPWNDPKRPLVKTKYEGLWVRATKMQSLGEGKVLLEIDRPYLLRGRTFEAQESGLEPVPRYQQIWSANYQGQVVQAFAQIELPNGKRRLEILEPASLKGQIIEEVPENLTPVRKVGLRWENYTEVAEWMPIETNFGLRYLQNTLVIVIMSIIGTVLSCAIVAYGFSRLRFPGRDFIFTVMLATMMLPGAVTLMPRFLIFKELGWLDTLLPLWVPTFFAGAFNVFLLKQFFSTIPMELEEAARIDGAGYFKTFWTVMLPLVKPALAAISIWTFMGAWNDFMGPLLFIFSPENVPLSYALQLFSGDRGGDAGLMMAFSTMAVMPVIIVFFLAQRYFIEGVQLSGLGGR
ncbi:MAG: carbohydrate ABC transporter permease [Fimbriimonadaceae bacterium]|nr:carbohydrate ABC transporter permease [Fimbriimonadaceae bacterium]